MRLGELTFYTEALRESAVDEIYEFGLPAGDIAYGKIPFDVCKS